MTPAVIDSKTCSNVPSYRLTSVDVPPMSKPITGLYGVVTVYPTTPPAGPDKIALEPLKLKLFKEVIIYMIKYQIFQIKFKFLIPVHWR